jgi:AraC-like DNA-binding protein
MMKRQTYLVKDLGPHNTSFIRTLGLDYPQGIDHRQGRHWHQYQVCHQDTFSLVAIEGCDEGRDSISYTKQEDYLKINFWLSGKHTTVLDGFGEHEHDRPEVFITCGPWDMIKMDIVNRESQMAAVALCVLRDFFPVHMGLSLDELPEPLRAMIRPEDRPFGLHSMPLTPDMVAAARAILAAPFAVRRSPVYAQAKAVELMCLLVNRMSCNGEPLRASTRARRRQESRLHEARELLARRYSEPITLEHISKEVGLNKMALTSGFRQLFGMSVYDYLQKERMEHAYELLQDQTYTIARVAEAVGYGHSCNFSTAFRARFGCTPQEARGNRR